MNKTNIEVCPFCGASPKMKMEKIPKPIGSPQPQKYIYYYTCTCGKVVASSANDCVMTSQEAIDYAGYLWNSACQRVKPAAPTPVEVEVTEPVKKTPKVKKVESLGSFVETVIAAVEEKAAEEEPVKVEPEEVQEPATETPIEDVPTEEVEQEVVDTQPEQEEPVEPAEELAVVAEETTKPTKPAKSASSNPMLASLDDILGTSSRKKSTKKD